VTETDLLFKISKYQKIKYDKETDILYIRLKDLAIDEKENKKGVILDYSADE
jgi:uncharacterized protein YuzE